MAASAHSGNCSTLRNRSNGKAGSAKSSQLEGSWIWRGKCSGHISNGGVQSTSAPLATPGITTDPRKVKGGKFQFQNALQMTHQ